MATAPARVEPARIGGLGRLTGALFSPRQTFEDIARQPTWLLPVILYCVLGLTLMAIFTQRVGWESFMRKQFEKSAQWSQLSTEQQQTRIQQAARFAPIFGSTNVIVFNFLGPVIAGAVLMGAFRILSGAQIGFKTSLGIFTHACMPLAVSAVLGILILFLKDPEAIDLENLVGSNVGTFLSSGTPRWQQSLGGSLDLFSFWVISLLALGYATADPKRVSRGTAWGVVLALWGVFVLGKAGLTAVFS